MPAHGARRERQVGEVAFEKLDAGQVIEVPPVPGDEVVDDAHGVTATRRALRRDGIR